MWFNYFFFPPLENFSVSSSHNFHFREVFQTSPVCKVFGIIMIATAHNAHNAHNAHYLH